MKRSQPDEVVSLNLNPAEVAIIDNFRRLCASKFGERFLTDADFQRQIVAGLFAGTEDFEKHCDPHA